MKLRTRAVLEEAARAAILPSLAYLLNPGTP